MELAAILMLFLATCSFLVSKNNISPGFLLTGSFFSVYFLQSIFASDMYSSVTATLIIFVISAFFILGEITGTVLFTGCSYRLTEKEAVIGRNLDSDQYKTRVAVIINCLGILALVGTYNYTVALGIFDSGDIVTSILRIGAIREKIFTSEIYVPFFDRVGFLLSYTGVVLSIFYWYFFGWRWWLFIPNAAVLGLGMAQAGRAGIIIVILQWILALYIKAKTTGENRLRSKIIFMGTLIFMIFVFIQVFREGLDNFNPDSLTRTISSLRGYFLGGVSAFAFYIDNIFDVNSISYGKYSFSSLFSFLGIYEQEPGIYDFYAAISDYGEATNIYTAYRSFIDDFSLLGTVTIYAISGFILTIFAHLFARGYNFYLAILVPALSWIICSPMVSLTYFNSFLLSVICPYIILRSAAFRLKNV